MDAESHSPSTAQEPVCPCQEHWEGHFPSNLARTRGKAVLAQASPVVLLTPRCHALLFSGCGTSRVAELGAEPQECAESCGMGQQGLHVPPLPFLPSLTPWQQLHLQTPTCQTSPGWGWQSRGSSGHGEPRDSSWERGRHKTPAQAGAVPRARTSPATPRAQHSHVGSVLPVHCQLPRDSEGRSQHRPIPPGHGCCPVPAGRHSRRRGKERRHRPRSAGQGSHGSRVGEGATGRICSCSRERQRED